jgi:hypothetical protein
MFNNRLRCHLEHVKESEIWDLYRFMNSEGGQLLSGFRPEMVRESPRYIQ